MNSSIWFLSALIFAPAVGGLILLLLPREKTETIKRVSFVITLLVFLATVFMAIPGFQTSADFQLGEAGMQHVSKLAWIPSFNIEYYLGMDGISFPLVLLTSFISMLAMLASWPIQKNVKAYCCLFLLLETGMLGVFLVLDFFLFFVLWEVMLLPMFFLIGVWGGPRREYAAIKFFLYTLVGGVLMLIAILMLYFRSDLRKLDEKQLAAAQVVGRQADLDKVVLRGHDGLPLGPDKLMELEKAGDLRNLQVAQQIADIRNNPDPQHTFNILALQQIGQHTQLFDNFGLKTDEKGQLIQGPDGKPVPILLFGKGVQWWAFLLLFIGFIIKVPSVPLHTWLPDAHVEAPTPISMILAGVLLKMGGYGIIRICYPICPDAGYELAWLVCFIGVLSMVYGAFAALAQKDFKRLVAYSSVSHMGYVVLGLGVCSAVAANNYNAEYWMMGMNGAMFQMIAHGISSAGMFFLVGVVYDRVHHRDLDKFGGLFAKMPGYSGVAILIFFAGLGLPGLCGFIGEVLVVLSVWNFSVILAVISAFVVILTAAYILWVIQRVYLGPEYKGPHAEALTPMTRREWWIVIPLCVFAIVFGVYPRSVLDYMTPSVNKTVQDLADWKRDHTPAAAIASDKPEAGQPKNKVGRQGQDANEVSQHSTRPAQQADRVDTLERPPGPIQFASRNQTPTRPAE